ncbi:DUF4873 domain-containing protein [Saccharomonospora sp. CUA-673]|uniref:DUF4873 domain-containing protein n=1 Tax=Saccharomonospora sp. CUA-673 TaxID=1904969 RepID=UPI00095A31CB|nr:DUF4873 domain-containing protein [Saccharomonospora sp. CUA-673]OLT48199.1 DUF4873 domain-containing protein [Saccharomonospora sp. CUA-673]
MAGGDNGVDDNHDHPDHDGYRGAATLTVEDRELEIEVDLRGHFQPIDGYYHWYGRITRHDELMELAGGRKKSVRLSTPEGSADGTISDPDPWERYRITGTSTPPFTVPTTLEAVETPPA